MNPKTAEKRVQERSTVQTEAGKTHVGEVIQTQDLPWTQPEIQSKMRVESMGVTWARWKINWEGFKQKWMDLGSGTFYFSMREKNVSSV